MLKRILALCLACLGALAAGQALAEESTSVGGRLFIDFSYIDQKSDNGAGSVKTDASGVGTDVKRGYLIVKHSFDEVWSANVTTDFNYAAAANYATVFIKKAYLQAKVSDAFAARLGSYDLPWIPYDEDLYGYRYLEKVVVERLNYGTSADWGLNAGGNPAEQFNYSISAVNGNGYRNTTRSKNVDWEGRVGFVPVPGLTIAAGFYDGKRGRETQTTSAPNTAERFDALVAYVNAGWRVGGEYFTVKNWSAGSILGTAPEDKADGYSLWVSYDAAPQWSVFARADGAKPSKDVNPNLKDRYYNAGIAWHANKKIDVAFAVKHEKVEHGIITTANGDTAPNPSGFDGRIGGSVDGTYTEGGVWLLVNF